MTSAPCPLSEFSHVPVALTTRFEVLARDNHTCQFCGRRAPDVTLSVERVRPIIQGGSSSSLNMVTTCTDCGVGRRAVIARMYRAPGFDAQPSASMVPARSSSDAWKDALAQYNLQTLDRIVGWLADVGHPDPSDAAKRSMLTLIHRAGADRVWAAFVDTAPRVVELDGEGRASAESVERIINNLPRWVASLPSNSESRRLLSIRGVLRSRLVYVQENEVMDAMSGALDQGVPLALIEAAARQCRGWAEFWSALSALSGGAQA